MRFAYLFVSLIAAHAIGCASSTALIPGGRYISSSHEAAPDILPPNRARWHLKIITVREDTADFHVDTETPEGRFDSVWSYHYELLRSKDGGDHLKFYGSSNSAFYLIAIIPYKWDWNGGKIIRIKEESGRSQIFELQGIGK
jgi:hypothetical protein